MNGQNHSVFSWKLTSENAILFGQGNVHFEPYNTKFLDFEIAKAETGTDFGSWRGWHIDDKPFDYKTRTFYILHKLPLKCESIGYFGGKES